MTKSLRLLLLFCVLIFSNLSAQIKIIELTSSNSNYIDSSFYNLSSTRNILFLNSGWKAYHDDEQKQIVNVDIPAIFEEEGEIIFEKEINLSAEQIANNSIRLHILGIGNSAEVILNDLIIYKNSNTEIPFSIDLNSDILNYNSPNILKIKISHSLDSENTIPVKQRFLFPKNYGGVLKDIFLHFTPKVRINSFTQTITESNKSKRISLNLNYNLERDPDIEFSDYRKFRLNVSLFDEDDTVETASKSNIRVDFRNTSIDINNVELRIRTPKYWDTKNPFQYLLKTELLYEDSLIDKSITSVSLSEINFTNDNFVLNKKELELKGITYIPAYDDFKKLNSFSEIQNDLEIIKDAGFNAIKISKALPHPLTLKLCEDIGLFVILEIPMNSIPEQFTTDNNFVKRVNEYVDKYTNYYSQYKSVIAFSLGSSYLADSEEHRSFLSALALRIKNTNPDKRLFASFIGVPTQDINGIDKYGIEIYSTDLIETFDEINSSSVKNKIFINEITYPSFLGSTNGYSNKFSLEAQAQYYEQFLTLFNKSELNIFFFNSVFDFRGNYSSLYTGYSEEKLYPTGIAGEDRSTNRLTYKVINSKLNGSERVTIPMGSTKDDTPLFFILFGVALAVIMAIVINSNKKFREDATRALLRPYNFYADIRDQRILTGSHTVLLMFILGGSHALFFTNLLFFLRSNILLDKIILSFGMPQLTELIAYLAYDPLQAFVYLYIASIALFIGLSLLIKLASLFVRTRVNYSSIIFVVIWAFLPLSLFIPIEIILYRILSADIINLYIYIVLGLFVIWIFKRLLQGVYVIFDTRLSLVYFYGFLLITFVFGGVLLGFQLSNSTIYYLINAFKQYSLM